MLLSFDIIIIKKGVKGWHLKGGNMKKAERLNQELIYLKDKKKFQLKDLMENFNISRRTALRDVQELEQMGLALYTDYGRGGSYKLLEQKLLTSINFNDQEIQAIFFAIKSLDLVSSTPFEKSYPQIRKKLLEVLPKKQQEEVAKILEVISYHQVSPVKPVNHLSLILEAILNKKLIKTKYTQYKEEWKIYQLFDLFYRSGVWFCNAYDVEQAKWQVIRCDYLTELSFDDSGRQAFTQEEMESFLHLYETEFHDIAFECELTDYGKELFLKRHYPNMKLVEVEGLALIQGSYNEEHEDYMIQYLISLGKHVKIIFPESLKEMYKNELQRIIDRY